MFEAQYLFAQFIFGPWMPRRGDNVSITADVAGVDGSLEVKLYTKNREDTGEGLPMTGGISATAAKRYRADFSGVKELVRYRFEVTEDDAALFRMLVPVWFDDLV